MKHVDENFGDLDKLRNFLIKKVIRVGLQPATAEDFAQDTLLRMFEIKDRFDPSTNVMLWSTPILRTIMNKNKVNKKYSGTLYFEPDKFNFILDEISNYDSFEYSQEIDQLKNKLSENQFQIMILFAMGYSHKEICDMLDLNLNAVKKGIIRGREKLLAN